jgi:two-component system invasion response regulator UvrY
MDAVTVLLIDEYPLLRRGCRQVLEGAGYQVIAEATSGVDGVMEFTTHHPQLVVMEITAAAGGIGTIRQLLAIDASARILVLSMHDSPAIAERALQAGGRGYIAKSACAEEFLTGARQVSHGGRYLSEELALALALSPLSNRVDPLAVLSSREYEIFQLLVEGRRTADLAKALGLTPKSVTNSYLRIKRKLHAESLPDLVRFAIAAGTIKHNVLPYR